MHKAMTATVKRDLSLSALVFLIGAGLYLGALKIPPPMFDPLGSAAVPKAIAIGLIVLAGLLVVQSALGARRRPVAPPIQAEAPDEVSQNVDTAGSDPWAAVAAVLVPVVYILSIQYGLFDFAIGSSLFVFVYGFVFMPVPRRSLVLWLIPVSLLFGVGLTLIYTQLFTIDLPLDALISLGLSL